MVRDIGNDITAGGSLIGKEEGTQDRALGYSIWESKGIILLNMFWIAVSLILPNDDKYLSALKFHTRLDKQWNSASTKLC